jgi:hypothetical protein
VPATYSENNKKAENETSNIKSKSCLGPFDYAKLQTEKLPINLQELDCSCQSDLILN